MGKVEPSHELGPPSALPLVSPTASEEYYQLLMSSEDHPCSAHVPSCTVEEIESVTSEFIVKNVVSVLTSEVFPQEAQLRWPRSSPRGAG